VRVPQENCLTCVHRSACSILARTRCSFYQ
jgi:hypothetical protein